jgi:hypothetical protein
VVSENAQTSTAAINVLSLFVDTGIDLYPEVDEKSFVSDYTKKYFLGSEDTITYLSTQIKTLEGTGSG